VREIVAFANTDGGKLLIGIGDDRSIKGLKYADEDEYILVRAIEKHCSPHIEYTIDRVHVGDEYEVLVFTIMPSTEHLHYVLQEVEAIEPVTKKPKNLSILSQFSVVRRTYIRVAGKPEIFSLCMGIKSRSLFVILAKTQA
jgi:predicted HTH transcriptional regulator